MNAKSPSKNAVVMMVVAVVAAVAATAIAEEYSNWWQCPLECGGPRKIWCPSTQYADCVDVNGELKCRCIDP